MSHRRSRTKTESSRLSQLAGAARTGLAGLLTAAFALGVAGCGDGAPTGPGGGGPSSAVVAGSVQQTSGSASRIASAATASPGPASATSDATSSASAATAAVASVDASGDLDTMAEAEVQADGTFRIEDVPAGRSGLVVVARDDEGAEVGRVLVHGETRAGAVTTVSPITLETTVEGYVYSELRAEGEDEAADNSGALALFVRMDDETAASVLSSAGSIDALARAYAGGQATMSSIFAEVGSDLDASARAEAMTRAALDYARARDGGTTVEAANEAFAAAALDAGADLEATSEALAGYATAATAETAGTMVSSDAHLALTKQLVSLDLRARERLASDQSGSFDGSTAEETASALATARADVEAAVSLAEVEAALQAAADDSQQLVFDGVLGLLGDASLTLQSEVESELEAAFAEADLAADLEGSATASGLARAVAAYRTDVDAASDTVVATMPDSVSLDAEATSRILVASNGDAVIHH